MRARLDGPFRVIAEDGSDVTPKGMKERALLALLLMSPGQRRTRVWLQDKLWSDREADQASGSCRQALSNLRKTLGPARDRLMSDRTTIWIAPEAEVEDRGEGELLDDLDVRDPEFVDWLRDQRQSREIKAQAPAPFVPQAATQRPAVVIYQRSRAGGERAAFLLRGFAQRIGGELVLLQGFDVVQSEDSSAVLPEHAVAIIEIESYAEGEAIHALVQVLSAPSRRLGWAGRLQLHGPVQNVWESDSATRVVNRSVQAVCDIAATQPALKSLTALNRAIQRIYEFDRSRLAKADELLATASTGDTHGLALAWRSFVRLTWALEFRDQSYAREALNFADEALQELGDHPVVLALASQVKLKVSGDLEAAHYLALRAVEKGDQNPYALDALCQSMIMRGNYEEADALATRARRAAEGLAHSFNWDMQACLSALSVGRLEAARDAAADCHGKMPFYRPALRYLVALSLLLDRPEDSQTYTGRLRRLEPDFEPRFLTQPDYPVDTLRALGLVEKLRTRLG
ncbi:AfsR/SARP family transcriptional regulator [Tabrizicola sp.]|uniref:AfsR/SARP family transcriptional regulator n=1 Tax=Tabrizicola sp. TaxID=2005166 RepID=UPI003F3F9849